MKKAKLVSEKVDTKIDVLILEDYDEAYEIVRRVYVDGMLQFHGNMREMRSVDWLNIIRLLGKTVEIKDVSPRKGK